jgi:hypothetical protein
MPTAVRISVHPGIFNVTTSTGDALEAIASNDDFLVAYKRRSGSSSVFHATRTGASMDVGQLPIQIGGNWLLTNGKTGCTASLAPTNASAMCEYVRGVPRWAEIFAYGKTVGTRTSTRASIFGELGGTWSFTANLGAQCEIVFEGSSAQATCISPRWRQPETVRIDFNGATASGSASTGVEFAAHRL